MSARPNIICHPRPGTLVSDGSSNPGFVETWNWLVDSWDALKGSAGVYIEDKGSDRPVLKLQIVGGDGIDVEEDGDRIMVKLHQEDSSDDGDDNAGKTKGGGGNGGSGGKRLGEHQRMVFAHGRRAGRDYEFLGCRPGGAAR